MHVKQSSIEELERLVTDAENLWRKGRLAEAAEIYENLLQLRLEETSDDIYTLTAADFVIIERLADISVLLGNSEASDYLLDGMAGLSSQAGNIFATDYTKLKRIHLAVETGKFLDACDIFKSMSSNIGDIGNLRCVKSELLEWEKITFWENFVDADKFVLFSRFYLAFGRLLAGQGQYQNALTCFDRGLDFTGENVPDLARKAKKHLQIARITALLEMGELKRADEKLREIMEQRFNVRQLGLLVQAIEIKGKLALLKGDFGTALEKFNEIFEICRSHHLSAGAEIAALNLAQIFILINQVTQALEIISEVRQRVQKAGNFEMLARCSFLQEIARTRTESSISDVSPALSVTRFWRGNKKPEKQKKTANPEINDFSELEPNSNFLTFFEDRALTFHFYLGARDFQSAAEWLERLTETFEGSDSRLINLRLRVFKAMLAYYTGDFANAESLFSESSAELDKLKLLPELWQCLRFLVWCRTRLNCPSEDITKLSAETQQILDRIVESLKGEDRVIFLLNKWTAEEEALAAQINRLVHLKATAENLSWFKRFKLKKEISRELFELISHIDYYKTFVANRFIENETSETTAVASEESFWTRIWKYPLRRAMIAFLVLPDRILIVSRNWLRTDFAISAVSRVKLRNTVRKWHQALIQGIQQTTAQSSEPENESATSQDIQSITRELTEALQLNVLFKKLPRRVNSLTFVPDDCLHGFPFAALRFDDWYLIEKFRVNIAFQNSFSDKPRLTKEDLQALTVGVSEGAKKYSALKGVRSEIEEVSAWLKQNAIGERRVNDFEETAAAPGIAVIKNILPFVSLAHISCHGIFEPDDIDKTGLLLNPKTSEILNLREISRLDLTRLQHITLSSCWGADHFVLPGRWIIGLPEMLCRAGANSLLGSLWMVHDRSSVVLIKNFYDKLNHFPRDEALRQAQLQFLRGDNSEGSKFDLTNPFFWAGFTLYGSHERLEL
jgi:CHAT domain-containing protein/tetratricopeptide (TPR) repeat protein